MFDLKFRNELEKDAVMGASIGSILLAISVDRIKEQTLCPLFKRLIAQVQHYANFYQATEVQPDTRVEICVMSDHPTDHQVVEDVAEETAVPVGWAHLIATEDCVRLTDGITMSLADAIELEMPSVVKQEHYLSLPAIVKFYKERLEYCTHQQVLDLQAIFHGSDKTDGYDGYDGYELQSSVMFVSRTTKAVHVNLCRLASGAITAATSDVEGFNIDEYKLHENPDQFPTGEDIIRYIPGVYEQMSALRHKAEGGVLSSCKRATTVAIHDSILSVDMRRAIIELDGEESELKAKLEELHKRKRELEEAGRNVRRCHCGP